MNLLSLSQVLLRQVMTTTRLSTLTTFQILTTQILNQKALSIWNSKTRKAILNPKKQVSKPLVACQLTVIFLTNQPVVCCAVLCLLILRCRKHTLIRLPAFLNGCLPFQRIFIVHIFFTHMRSKCEYVLTRVIRPSVLQVKTLTLDS